jgi:putative DNA methylase
MVTFSDLVMEARAKIVTDALGSPSFAGAIPGKDARESVNTYADAVCTYLAFAVSKLADWNSAVCSWIPAIEGIRDTFARSALPMVWDFAEINPFSNSVGSFRNHVEWVASAVAALVPGTPPGSALQRDAAVSAVQGQAMISTDPPYYDNIGYADLSDFFYVWLRRSLASIYPSEMSTLLVPKSQELIAASYRFNGDRRRADAHFEEGLGTAFRWMRDCQDERFPLTIYYAFKQAEDDDDELGRASTGWETMLQGLLDAGFRIEGTWPMRTERSGRMRDNKSNALASSIILVCRPRAVNAAITTRRAFVSELRASLPQAMRALQTANIAPVDLAQSAIGPGMAVFSRFTRVIDAEGNTMSVRAALGLINQVLDELVTEEEGELDPDTRWALAWFEQFGFGPGSFGIAETLSKAKNTSIARLVDAGIVVAPAGTVRLIAADDMDPNWNPASADRLTLWEVAHHLSRALEVGGEHAAALLLRRVGGLGVEARSLAYRLYMLCERKKWAKEALAYNALVVAWPDLVSQAADGALPSVVQQTMEV